MAGPSLGTLLIQRLDAALGTNLSQQTQIVNRATADPVTHAERSARLEPIPGTLARDSRTNVDRATSGTRSGARVDRQASTGDPSAAGRSAGPAVTTSATTTLGLAARIILNLFADSAATSATITARTPLFNQAPGQGAAAGPGTGAGPTARAGTGATSAGSGAATGPATGTGSAGAAGAAQAAATASNVPTLAQTLAHALSQSLQQSGLFYESHLQGLLSGKYRLTDIQQEPQARLGRGTPGQPGQATTPGASGQAGSAPSGTGTAGTAATGTGPGTAAQPGSVTGDMPADAARPHAGQPSQPLSSSAFTPGVDPATHPIVRQQLEALAEQNIQWRGEAWPGAPMEWQVRRQARDHEAPQPADDADTPWQSEIRLQLPRLGDLWIDVRLAGRQVHVTLRADDSATSMLRDHAGELYDQMSQRQLELTSITFVSPDSDTGPATDDSTPGAAGMDQER